MSKKKQPMVEVGQEIDLIIDRLSFPSGEGVGRFNGLVVFVENSAPQDQVKVSITLVKKNFAKAKIIKILQASPHRTIPLCKIADICGGCSWQQVEYMEQVRQKESIVRKHLQKHVDESTDFTFHQAKPIYRYRNRIQIHKKNGTLGFFKSNSPELVPIDDCHICKESLVQTFSQILADPKFKTGDHRIEIIERESGAEYYSLNEKESQFTQAHEWQNNKLVHRVFEICCKSEPKFVLDFFCGSGNFSFALAKIIPKPQITGVDTSSVSINRANQLRTNSGQTEKMSFLQADVLEYVKNNPNLTADIVILDPPRQGLDSELLNRLLQHKFNKLIYVSCNPATLQRDLDGICENYNICSIDIFDMFPHTPHVETLVYLEKN